MCIASSASSADADGTCNPQQASTAHNAMARCCLLFIPMPSSFLDEA
jgi:hypothetical protein